ncbi:MAG: DUF1036 domain-containing protein [Reyranellaceae bacterium]
MRLLLMAVLAVPFAGPAQAELVLCNRTDRPVQVAVAEDETDEDAVVVKGWTGIAPRACSEVADNFLYDYAFFAFQPGSGRTWEDDEDGAYFCVRMGRNFRIKYEDPGLEYERAEGFQCPAGAVRRGFIVLTNEYEEEVRFDLK